MMPMAVLSELLSHAGLDPVISHQSGYSVASCKLSLFLKRFIYPWIAVDLTVSLVDLNDLL